MLKIVCIALVLCVGSAVSYHWTLPATQELFRTLLSNVTECQWISEEEALVSSSFGGQFGNNFLKVNSTYYGICAPNVDACIHLGTTPRPVAKEYEGPNCTVCCARRPCASIQTSGHHQRSGVCLLPEILQFNGTTGEYGDNGTGSGGSNFTSRYGGGQYYDGGYDEEERDCLGFGGQLAEVTGNANWTIWWDMQCPMSGRCCLFPEVDKCQTCGRKYGKTWNFSQTAVARSDGPDETLAWKTAVHQMAGTGWNLGMQPVASPGFAEQYSQTPPNYDSLLSPQLWNNGLNFLTGNKDGGKSDEDDDDNDEDDYRGWCWQVAVLSKNNNNLRCGGALIAEKYILTTAACVNFTSGTYLDYKVRFGATDLRKNNEKHAVEIDIAAVHLHTDYDSDDFDNNIAIIELKHEVACNGKYICTICLPSPFIMYFGNLSMGFGHEQWIRNDVRQCVATGWGRKVTGGGVSYLKEIPYLPIYHNDTFCETNIRTMKGVPTDYVLPNNSFCAAPQPTNQGKIVSACQGDAGGPLACWYGGRFYLTGLLSNFNGQRCETGKIGNIVAKVLQPNRTNEPQPLLLDVFTDIAQFIPWIYGIIYGF